MHIFYAAGQLRTMVGISGAVRADCRALAAKRVLIGGD